MYENEISSYKHAHLKAGDNKNQKKNKDDKRKQKTTSKLLIFFLFLNCTLIEIFTCWTTVKAIQIAPELGMIDFTPLTTLIGAVVSEVIGFAIYSIKSAKENSANGIVYEMAMKENNDVG